MTVLNIIRAEAHAHRTVVIDAFKKDGSREQREIEPYSLKPGKVDDLLVFWCLKRNAIRSLLISNIVRAEPTGRTFMPRFPIEL